MRLALITAAALILAGCNRADDDATGNTANTDAAQANSASGNATGAATAEVAALPTEPLPPDQAIALMKERHENYEKIGDAMKLVSRELKSSSPDLAAVRQGASTMATLAPQIPDWFPPGTGPDVGKTEAKAEIWQKPDDFVAKAKDMSVAALALQQAAQGTDLDAIRAAHGNLGKSCKACHDLYREEHE